MTSQSLEERSAVSRIGGLVLINAMIFQEVLADHDPCVLPLQRMLAADNLSGAFADHWKFIIDEIDYYPIFYPARTILLDLTVSSSIVDALADLARAAQQLITMRAALRHDLMGRIYHRLLVAAKFLGTYYTGIPAATLLLKLALDIDAWDIRWLDLDQIRKLRIGDLACGTGTLLMAAGSAVTDNYISASASHGQPIDLDGLHSALQERVLYGYNVLPSAIHLTASTLALRVPGVAFKSMNLFSLPLGGAEHRLGSVEYLQGAYVQIPMDLFGTATSTQQVTGDALEELALAPLPLLDLAVMNPPFTRSVGGNLLFGSVPETERSAMQRRLQLLIKESHALANVTAGLGSVFVATAHPRIKAGGRIALVLPKAVLSGQAWAPTRELLAGYHLDYVVISHDPDRWNFSESTSLSETLLVATKTREQPSGEAASVVFLNLWRNPSTRSPPRSVCRTFPASAPCLPASLSFASAESRESALMCRPGHVTAVR